MTPRIGIGVTTYKRPRTLELWHKQMAPTLLMPDEAHNANYIYQVHVADDSVDRKGVAYRKNECLKALKDCDYVFIFDDDCFPIKEGWAKLFIDASKANNHHHLMYLKDTPTIKTLWTCKGVGKTFATEYNNCSGCMMFLTREAIQAVGAYDERFGIYGYEHADYSNRVHAAGLTPMGKYTCPAGASEYIYSMDLDFHRRAEFQDKVGHKPSMSAEESFNAVKVSANHYNPTPSTIHIPL